MTGVELPLSKGNDDLVEFSVFETKEVSDGPNESSGVFDPNEVAVAHVFSRTVRRCFLMGDDPISGKNFDHRKRRIEQYLQQFAAYFGIDLLCFSLLSNHFHLILRSRPDVVATWDDKEVARRWLMLCSNRRKPDGTAMEPTQPEINSIAGCPIKREEIRSRLRAITLVPPINL